MKFASVNSLVKLLEHFRQRMGETDEKIKLLSSVREEDKSSVYERLKECLGERQEWAARVMSEIIKKRKP